MIEKIEYFTAGCPRSQISGKNLKKALNQLGLEMEFESIEPTHRVLPPLCGLLENTVRMDTPIMADGDWHRVNE